MLSKPITEARMEYGSLFNYLALTVLYCFPTLLGIPLNNFWGNIKYNVTKTAKINDT